MERSGRASKSSRIAAWLCAAVVVSVVGLRSAPVEGGARVCTATLNPDSVLAGSESTSVAYSLSESIGIVTSVTPPEDSGLRVSVLDAQASMLTLEATRSRVGTYTLRFTGDPDRTCSGDVRVIGM